jgi:integrase
MTALTVPEQPAPVLDLDQLAKLLKSCAGNTSENRRDTAIIRLFLDTGMRAGERRPASSSRTLNVSSRWLS